MDRIIKGIHNFRQEVFPSQKERFERLAAKKQEPMALFITCSDSRMNPNLITQTDPGDLFLLRNAGNIVPPYGAAHGGEGATIEYAVAVLGIKNIIVCGHSHCGAMKALLRPDDIAELPAVSEWFTYAEATRRIAKERHGDLTGLEFERAVIEENVLVQLNNLSTHPYVAARLGQREVQLHGWVYEIETGVVYEYDQSKEAFEPIGDHYHAVVPLCVRHAKAHALTCANGK
jgi:carbonic anhydrase